MVRKPRMGADPLGWIGDSRKEGKEVKEKVKVGRSKTVTRAATKTRQDGLQRGWIRATFIMRESHVERLKAMAYWERRLLKEIVDEAISGYLQGKTIKAIPKGGSSMPIQLGEFVLYSLEEISKAFGVTPTTLRSYIKKRGLRGRKVGGQWYVSDENLRKFFGGFPEVEKPAE